MGDFEIADYKSRNKKWRIQYGGQLYHFMGKLCIFFSNSLRNGYSGIFEVADYESEVRISKFEMADRLTNFMFFF